MLFSSLEFIFIFLPIFLAVYFWLPPRLRNACLLLGSLIFYFCSAWQAPFCTFLLLLSIVLTWFLALLLSPDGKDGRGNKVLLIVGIVYHLGVLFAYKYCGSLFSSINTLLGFEAGKGLPQINWLLPLGISFYTFTHLAYLIDVYRGHIRPEPSLFRYATFTAFFPKLTSGPITLWQEMSGPLTRRSINMKRLDSGLRDFIIGLGMKVLLADQIGSLWSQIGIIGYASISTPLAWLGSLAYALQLYFALYGYSLMAIGVGKMLGFRLPDSFRHPYIARTMTDFWRRWHITLGAWFRNYLYIPLGGSRCSHNRSTMNLLIVWLVIGLWLGASWNFVLWGLFVFAVIFLEKNYIGKALTGDSIASHIGSHIYMVLLILIQWTILAVTDLSELGTYLGRLFGIGGNVVDPKDFTQYLGNYGWKIAFGILFATPLPRKLFKPLRSTYLGTLILFAIFAAAIYCVAIGANETLLYFHF